MTELWTIAPQTLRSPTNSLEIASRFPHLRSGPSTAIRTRLDRASSGWSVSGVGVLPNPGFRFQIVFRERVIFDERRWVTFGERRSEAVNASSAVLGPLHEHAMEA